MNLDFENPVQPLTPIFFPFVSATDAIPGWTAYVGGVQQNQVIYNTRPLDAAEVTLQGAGSDSLAPIQGDFTVELFGSSKFGPQQSAAIGQTGQIPVDAMSLIFWGYASDVSFGGQALSLVVLGNTQITTSIVSIYQHLPDKRENCFLPHNHKLKVLLITFNFHLHRFLSRVF